VTPLESWVLFGACIALGAWVYVAVAGGRRYRRMERQALDHDWPTMLYPLGPPIRISGGIYDAEARGDFDHDPIRDHDHCEACNAMLRRALIRVGDRHLGPRSADDLVAAIREELDS
jgi:hypothetical protein